MDPSHACNHRSRPFFSGTCWPLQVLYSSQVLINLMIGQEEHNRNDVLDFLVDGMQVVTEKENEDGTIEYISRFDPEIAWTKGHMINQPFGRSILRLNQFEALGKECYNNMYAARAKVMAEGIRQIGVGYRRSIDAKSSETYKDPHNTQDSLVHIISKNKIVRQYDVKGERSQSFIDSVLHRDAQKDSERD